MKIKSFETDYVFGLELVAEDLKEAAWITRFQLNVKREVPSFAGYAKSDGEFLQYVSFRRKKDKISSIRGK